jgi:hypothetical protein
MAGTGKLTIETGYAFIDELLAHNADIRSQYVQISVSDTGTACRARCRRRFSIRSSPP